MKVKAKSKGQYNGTMIYLGEVFEISEKDLAPWMEKVETGDRRSEERDPGEHEERIAQEKGWA